MNSRLQTGQSGFYFSVLATRFICCCEITDLQKATIQAAKYCRYWNLNCNVNRPTILVFYDAGKLKTNNGLNMDDQKKQKCQFTIII